MITMCHIVTFVAQKCKELIFFVVSARHFHVFVPFSCSQCIECFSVIIDNPLQAHIIPAGNIFPHCVRGDRNKVELLPGCFKRISHISVPIGEIAVVMYITPIEFQVMGRW